MDELCDGDTYILLLVLYCTVLSLANIYTNTNIIANKLIGWALTETLVSQFSFKLTEKYVQ